MDDLKKKQLELAERLKDLNPGTAEFDQTLRAIKAIEEVRLSPDAAKIKAARVEGIWNLVGKIAGGGLAILGVLFLGDVKEGVGLIDKDEFSIVRTLFPK